LIIRFSFVEIIHILGSVVFVSNIEVFSIYLGVRCWEIIYDLWYWSFVW